MSAWKAPKPYPGQTYDDWLHAMVASLEAWVNDRFPSEDETDP